MNYEKMKGPELVAAYNAMPGVTPVKKFKDRATALKRIKTAQSIQDAVVDGTIQASAPVNEVAAMLDSTDDGIPAMFKIPADVRKAAWDRMPPPKPSEQAKRSSATTPQTKTKAVASGSVLATKFKARPGTFREKLLVKLENHLGSQVSFKDLCIAVYGNDEKANFGPLKMCLKGAQTSVQKDALPYTIKIGDDGSVGIYSK